MEEGAGDAPAAERTAAPTRAPTEPADEVAPTATAAVASGGSGNGSGYTEPDLYMTLRPWDVLVAALGMEDAAEVYDLTTLEDSKAFYQSFEVGARVAFGNPRDLPVAVAEDPGITVAGVRAVLDGGYTLWGTGNARYGADTVSLAGFPNTPCEEEGAACPSFEALSYYEEVVAMSVTDGRMVIYAMPAATDALSILDLVSAERPVTESGSPDDVRAGLAFFRMMHEGFGIPYDAMTIYAYDRVEDEGPVEASWPEKYLSVYWAGDGDIVVPRVTTEEVNEQRDTVEVYALRVAALSGPAVFRRWDDPLRYAGALEEAPDTEVGVQIRNCLPGPVCALDLFDREGFREAYYELGNFPFEAVQMATTSGGGGEEMSWAVGYVTNRPLLGGP